MCTMRHMTQTQLAKAAGIDTPLLRGILQGKAVPTEQTERAIRKALGLPKESDELLNSVYLYTYESGGDQ